MNDVPSICKREAQPRDNIEYNHKNKKKVPGSAHVTTPPMVNHHISTLHFSILFSPIESYAIKKCEEQRHHLRKPGAWFSTIKIKSSPSPKKLRFFRVTIEPSVDL